MLRHKDLEPFNGDKEDARKFVNLFSPLIPLGLNDIELWGAATGVAKGSSVLQEHGLWDQISQSDRATVVNEALACVGSDPDTLSELRMNRLIPNSKPEKVIYEIITAEIILRFCSRLPDHPFSRQILSEE